MARRTPRRMRAWSEESSPCNLPRTFYFVRGRPWKCSYTADAMTDWVQLQKLGRRPDEWPISRVQPLRRMWAFQRYKRLPWSHRVSARKSTPRSQRDRSGEPEQAGWFGNTENFYDVELEESNVEQQSWTQKALSLPKSTQPHWTRVRPLALQTRRDSLELSCHVVVN